MTTYKYIDVNNIPTMDWELDRDGVLNVNGQAVKAVDLWRSMQKDPAEPIKILLTLTLETPTAKKNRLIAEQKKREAENARWEPVKRILDEMAAARNRELDIKRRINTPAEGKNDQKSDD